MNKFSILMNNQSSHLTRLTSQKSSVMDLGLSTTELGLLKLWEIPEEHPALFDHELILLYWKNVNAELSQPKTVSTIDGDIERLINNKDKLQKAHEKRKM